MYDMETNGSSLHVVYLHNIHFIGGHRNAQAGHFVNDLSFLLARRNEKVCILT